MGMEQERRLAEGLRRSTSAGVRWQVLAQQVVMGPIVLPDTAADWLGANASNETRASTRVDILASSLGVPPNLDSWDGYPAARSRLLAAAQRADADLVTLSGDSHNAWAFDLTQGGRPAGIEIAGHSVTSPGFEAYTPGISDTMRVEALRAASPQLQWANTADRGYVTVQLTRERVTANWHSVGTIRTHTPALKSTHSMTASRGKRMFDTA